VVWTQSEDHLLDKREILTVPWSMESFGSTILCWMLLLYSSLADLKSLKLSADSRRKDNQQEYAEEISLSMYLDFYKIDAYFQYKF